MPNCNPPATEIDCPPGIPELGDRSTGTAAPASCDEVSGIPSVQRQFDDPLIFDNLADACRARLHQGRVGLHFDRLCDLPDL